ncbi:F-box domain [Phaffia rhodozyma]|uniref:F-box domain n=1 Tax=Phaffia rhodozyma TaxID=264483 RepID=A0A0F7SF32_PHARH|nr:F-box domain [Phaffia rhodozyma]
MDTLPVLPPEILLHILSYLPLCDLARCHTINSTWLDLIRNNQQSLYRRVADRNLKDSDLTMSDWLVHGVSEWKEFCRRRHMSHRNWRQGNHLSNWISPPLRDVWRIKIDEEHNFVMTTSRLGNIYAMDSRTSEILEVIVGVREYAHLEYDKGFMIFDTHFGNTLEVWRRTEDMSQDGQMSNPTENEASQQVSSTAFSTRSLFSLYAEIRCPASIRAYRFVYPILLIGSMSSQSAFLWDIPEKRMVGSIDISSANMDLINYVEKTERHILILGLHYMSVFSLSPHLDPGRQLHPPYHTLNIPSVPPSTEFVLDLSLDFLELQCLTLETRTRRTRRSRRSEGHLSPMRKAIVWETEGTRAEGAIFASTIDYSFTAAHVSEGDLILTSRLGKIFIVLDYASVFEDPSLESLHTICLDVIEPVFNLTFSYGSAVFSTRTQVLIIPSGSLPKIQDIRESVSRKEAGLPSLPLKIEIYSCSNVSAGAALECSSVQADRTRAMFAYNTRADPALDGFSPPEARTHSGYSVRVFDFTPPLS